MTKKTREFNGFKNRLRYTSPELTVDVEIRYATVDTEAVFKPEGIRKTGPSGGELRWEKGSEEWKVFEKQPDGTEKEIKQDEIKYYQEADGQTAEVEPFDSTKTIDIRSDRILDECNLDGPVSLGSVIPEGMEDNFGPDKEKGTKFYEIWAEQSSSGLYTLLEKLEKEKLKLFFPFVFRKGMSVHLCVAKIIRINGDTYMVMKTYAGPTQLKRPIKPSDHASVEPIKPLLAKPALRRKPIGVT